MSGEDTKKSKVEIWFLFEATDC